MTLLMCRYHTSCQTKANGLGQAHVLLCSSCLSVAMDNVEVIHE